MPDLSDAGEGAVVTTLTEAGARHFIVVSPTLGNPVCPTCYSNLGKPRRWPCDVELYRRALDKMALAYREGLELLSAPRTPSMQRIVDHLLVCKCPERPRCRPHKDDGVHQWIDLCDLPHDHGEPITGRLTLAKAPGDVRA